MIVCSFRTSSNIFSKWPIFLIVAAATEERPYAPALEKGEKIEYKIKCNYDAYSGKIKGIDLVSTQNGG